MNYFLGITQLGGYSPNITGGPWQERLQLKILGQLNEKLMVSYDVEQQPETPDSYDVKVNYDNKHELVFGDLTATFSGNEFASATKFLNGVMVSSKDKNYDFIAVPSAKLKSQIQGLTSQRGNNTTGPYNLGHGSIVQGSEHVELNGVALIRDKDYLIDYFEGKITFTRILTTNDEVKYSYEYTNILDLFFPSLSKRDFFGVQGRVTLDPSTIGKKDVEPVPVTINERESFPTRAEKSENLDEIEIPFTVEASESSEVVAEPLRLLDQILEDESVGKYSLKNYPVVPFSEVLTLKGRMLNKNEDYNIDYNTGLITLSLPVLPDEENFLIVSYSYYKTDTVTDNIPGDGGRGPYSLTRKEIVLNSEKVYINERFVIRDFDYSMDYDTGKITFNYNISNTSNIKVSYYYQVAEMPVVSAPEGSSKSVTFGVTYLKESAQKGSNSTNTDVIETFKQENITKNNGIIFLSNFPVLSTAEGGRLSLTVGSQTLVEGVDYVVPTVEVDSLGNALVIPPTKLAFVNDPADTSNGYYTGTIKMLTTFDATLEVAVVYTYSKSITGRFTSTGAGGRGPYYITGYRNIVPGSEQVNVWATGSEIKTLYTRNSSTLETNGDYSINYASGTPYIMFNKPLDTTKSYDIYFRYVAQQSNSSNDISQDLVGVDADFKFGDLLQINTNYAQTTNDKVISSAGTTEAFSFAANTTRIGLKFLPVIENSEKVYVNNYLMNRDKDYFIDYIYGTITFYYVTLGTKDAVTVDYKYQSDSGIQFVTSKIDKAYKYGIKSKVSKVSVNYNKRELGFDFSPLGGTAIGVGSNSQDLSLELEPLALGFRTSYLYRETNNPIGTSHSNYTRNYERIYTGALNPFGLADVTFSQKNQEVHGDPLSPGGALTADSYLNSYSLGIIPKEYRHGFLSFTQKYDGQSTFSQDRVNFTKGITEAMHLNYGLGFTNRIKFSTDMQLSEPKALNTQTGEVTTSWKTTRDLSYDTSIDLTFPRVNKLMTYAKHLNHQEFTYLPTPEGVVETKNTTYHIDFNPVNIVSTSYDYNRQETPSVLVSGKNPKNEKQSTNIAVEPHSSLSTKWMYTEDHTINETASESKGDSNTYSANWRPISFEKFKLNSNYTLYNRKAVTPSGTFEVATDNRTFTQDYTLTFTPAAALSIAPGVIYEEYYNVRSTSTTELKTNNQTLKCTVSFKPHDKFSLDADYNLKVTTDATDNRNRHRNWSRITSKYRAFLWGELVYMLEDEHNGGEVQAGGTLPDTDYLKTVNTWSLNFTIPQENPILNSIILTASYKTVNFENRIKSTDNLFASSLSFEGTLSF